MKAFFRVRNPLLVNRLIQLAAMASLGVPESTVLRLLREFADGRRVPTPRDELFAKHIIAAHSMPKPALLVLLNAYRSCVGATPNPGEPDQTGEE